MDSRAFRDALGQFATGVCLVSVGDADAGDLAMTVNSFASVSLEPPLVLWSIQNTAEYYAAFTGCERFGISVLARDQEALSSRYARREGHVIEPDHFTADEHGVPLLLGALATFSCRKWDLYHGGDHQIIVGEVVSFARAPGEPLVFAGGRYASLAV
jgi:flavin reductase (DIM6/NTAB) family NADH-FMN oxidoreductase RutF